MSVPTVRPIRNEQDYRTALAEIDGLIDAAEDSPEFDRLEVLSVLVADYEDKHHAIEAPDPISFLEFVMESRGLTRKDLDPYFGSRSRVAEILNVTFSVIAPQAVSFSNDVVIKMEEYLQDRIAGKY